MTSIPCIEGGTTHAWQALGLDTNRRDQLVSVRRCVWCLTEQEKAYGAGGRRPWRAARPAAEEPA